MITDKELLEYIDGNLTSIEANRVKMIIEQDADVRNRFETLSTVDSLLADQPEIKPATSFADNVMANLNKKLFVDYNTFWKKNLIVVIGIIFIGFIAAVVLLSSSTIDLFPTLQPQQFTLSERTINIDPGKINFFNQDLFIKGMIYLNAFLAIFLLERAVFRPLFKQKRQSYTI